MESRNTWSDMLIPVLTRTKALLKKSSIKNNTNLYGNGYIRSVVINKQFGDEKIYLKENKDFYKDEVLDMNVFLNCAGYGYISIIISRGDVDHHYKYSYMDPDYYTLIKYYTDDLELSIQNLKKKDRFCMLKDCPNCYGCISEQD